MALLARALYDIGELDDARTAARRAIELNRSDAATYATLANIDLVRGAFEPAIETLEHDFAGRGYGDLKGAVADAVVAEFGPVRERALELLADPAELDRVLAANADRANAIAEATLARVYDAVGFLSRRS